MSSKQKKLPHPMTYFMIISKADARYFVNKSTRPQASARHQFHRAYKPERKDYDSEFYQDIRKYGEDGFVVDYCFDPPEWMERRAHYMPANEGSKLALEMILKEREE